MNTYNKIIFSVDSYKLSHYLQMPEGSTNQFSYIESRGGDYNETVFFGLQYYLETYLSEKITSDDVEKMSKFAAAHGPPFNKEGWQYIVDKHDGKLPLRIRAVKEGEVVPTSNILVSVENTDPNCYWLTSWVETTLLRVWYPITVATFSRECKKVIWEFLEKTSDDPSSEIQFKVQDFGSRGVSSQESAKIGGAAHLVNFMGSDTIDGVLCANEIYNCDMAGFSIPAAEHSTITSWGRENESQAYANMIDKFGKPGAIFATVSDSYDIYNACENIWGKELKQKLIDSGSTCVCRPDSGVVHEVSLKCIQLLDQQFGSTVNGKGYKVLHPSVRLIYGDGINLDSIRKILETVTEAGYSATNIAFGCGGQLLQSCNRDTLKFAMKCSSITANEKEIDVYKDPVTDSGKKSKKGRLDLVKEDGQFKTVRLNPGEIAKDNSEMVTVFENGEILKKWSLAEIRERASL